MDRLTYDNFDLRIEARGEGYLAVVHSGAGDVSCPFTLPWAPVELENNILKLGRPQRGIRRVDTPESALAKDFGGRLFEAVFRDDVRACLKSSLDDAQEEGRGLRLRLMLQDAPQLANLPWEFLFNRAANDYLGLSARTPIVRFLQLPRPIPPLRVALPLRMLVLVSQPEGAAKLDVGRERLLMERGLAHLLERGLLHIDWLPAPRLDMLQTELRRHTYHLLHFIGHGAFSEQEQDGVLLLEDDDGRPRVVSGQLLAALLRDHPTMRLVLLNACEGARNGITDPFCGVATTLVQQGMPAVIGMQFEISDDAALTFAREFYTAVADGLPVDAAVAEGRKAIYADGNSLEWATPVLYLRAQDGQIFNRQTLTPADERRLADLARNYRAGVAALEAHDFARAEAAFAAVIGTAPDYLDADDLQQQAMDGLRSGPHLPRGASSSGIPSLTTSSPTLGSGKGSERYLKPILLGAAAFAAVGLLLAALFAMRGWTGGQVAGVLPVATAATSSALNTTPLGTSTREPAASVTAEPSAAATTIAATLPPAEPTTAPTATPEPSPTATSEPTVTPTVIPAPAALPLPPVEGGYIYFASNRAGNYDLYAVPAVGGALFRLTDFEKNEWQPDASLVSGTVLYSSNLPYKDGHLDGDYNLMLLEPGAEPAANNATVQTGAWDADPSWSPDGRQIAFVSTGRDDGVDNPDLFVRQEDGSVRQLTSVPLPELHPDWAPDGTRIVFTRIDGARGQLMLLDLGSGQTTQLTNDDAMNAAPQWSPDGRTIAFVRRSADTDANGSLSFSDGGDIWLLDAETLAVRQLTQGNHSEAPHWSPDGRYLVYSRLEDANGDGRLALDRGGTYADTSDIWIIGADGANPRLLVDDPADEVDPVWGP